MNFWKRLRWIGTLIVLVVALLTMLLALLRPPSADDETPAHRPAPAFKQPSGTTGL